MVCLATALAYIISEINQDIDFISFRICSKELDIDESGLIYVLNYIYEYVDVDIINISGGLVYLYHYKELELICKKITKKGIVIVSAFSNEGEVSYPAAFDDVLGVDVRNNNDDKADIIYVQNSIVNLYLPDNFYRVNGMNGKSILKGSSFAAAKVTGLISREMSDFIHDNLQLSETISNRRLWKNVSVPISKPEFGIKKAVIFPFNKESSALLRFSNMLNFKIEGIYDERLSGNTGRKVYNQIIKSFDSIEWSKNFDTIILSCTDSLTKLTKRDYKKEVTEKAKKFNKNIYTFEKIMSDYKNIFYPEINSAMVKHSNELKLHKTTLPIVGVFGTSSRQGKFSLQLMLKDSLTKAGYNVGHIATEPSGYLLGADYVFHFGYHSYLSMEPWECISILNELIWNVQIINRDILITGCQSGTLHYNNGGIEDFAIYQYAFLLGVMPDFIVLCVNPHDDLEYVRRTIQFINSIDEGKVHALVIFPIMAEETKTGICYRTKSLKEDEVLIYKEHLTKQFDLPVYSLGNIEDINTLSVQIINYF